MPLPRNQFMPEGAQIDLAKRQAEILRGGVPEVMKQAALETYHNPIINNTLAALPGTGEAMLAGDVADNWKQGNYKTAIGQALMGMAPYGGLIGKTVWHSSPKIFDKFEMAKVGSSNNGQAYGHGLYLADRPEEAMKYQPRDEGFEQMLSNAYEKASRKSDYPAMQVYEDLMLHKRPEEILESLAETGFNEAQMKSAMSALEAGKKAYQSQTAGALYKVELPDEKIAQMMDYYKPLSEQSEHVRNALAKAPFETKAGGDFSGSELYDMAQSYAADVIGNKNPAGGSQLLNELGIPGIRYSEQKYVAKPNMKPDYNYVVFDESVPQVLERNSNPIVDALRSK